MLYYFVFPYQNSLITYPINNIININYYIIVLLKIINILIKNFLIKKKLCIYFDFLRPLSYVIIKLKKK